MTYCVAIKVDAGVVFCSDSRTNMDVDQVSTYGKMYHFDDNIRQLVITSAGNLATTQAVISRLRKNIKDGAVPNLATVETIDDAADYVGEVSVLIQEKHAHSNSTVSFEATY